MRGCDRMPRQKAVTLEDVAESALEGEYSDYVVYHDLAVFHRKLKREHPKKLATIFEELSQTEHSHYEFWKKLSSRTKGPKVSRLRNYGIRFIEAAFGATFAIKFLQRHERATLESTGLLSGWSPKVTRQLSSAC
jgi:hypothetical protein